MRTQSGGIRARFIADRGQSLQYLVEGTEELKRDLSDEYAVYLANLQPDAVELKHVKDQRHYAPFEVDGKITNVACIAPADHHCFEDYEGSETATYLKVATADLRSVREALRFHETRVRLPGQIGPEGAPHLVGLRLVSASGAGLFQDTTVGFSPNLTCLIGPRGSGKSTVIEALRYVLARNPALSERTLDVAPSFANLAQGIQAANLRDTHLELAYENADGTRVVLSATFDPNEDVRTRVFSLVGDDLKVATESIATDFPVSIFSWSEMEVLGRQAGLQRDLVDRLLEGTEALSEDRERILQELADNRSELETLIEGLISAREADSGLIGRYRQYRDAFTAINTPEVATLFASLDASRHRSELLASVAQELETLERAVTDLSASEAQSRIQGLLAESPEDTQNWWRQEVESALGIAALDAVVGASTDGLLHELRERQSIVERLQADATAQTERVEQELRTKTHLDKEQAVLRDQRELARERFEAVDAARTAYLERLAELDEVLERRRKQITELTKAQEAMSEQRERELAPLNRRLAEVAGDRLRISVVRTHLGDRQVAEGYLNENVLTKERAGQYLHRRIAERLCAMDRPARISAALVAGDVAMLGSEIPVGSGEALGTDEANKLVEGCSWRRQDEDAAADVVDRAVIPLLRLAEQVVDDRVSIRLNGRAVDELSPGQRSSAMLPLIALAEKGPLVIDQPEDNLDNAMVGETLTRILADLKEQRQIIVSTHNPNIVVGGDAEQVVVLDALDGHRAGIDRTGSIDDESVIDAVLSVMEGGREAFETRRKRYGVP